MSNFSATLFLFQLYLKSCCGLGKVQVNGLHKLKRIEVIENYGYKFELINIEEAPSLESFTLRGEGEYFSACRINIDTCLSLRFLLFQGAKIIDSWLNNLLPRLPFLERLELEGCHNLQRIKISSGTLKRLILHCCKELVEVEIDAPSLLWFSYRGEPIFSSWINVSSECRANLRFTNYYPGSDTLWFVRLRKSISLANDQLRHFQLTVILEWRTAFVVEELQKTGLPKACEVEHLELRIPSADVCKRAVLSVLLWSCHPTTISCNHTILPKDLFYARD